MACRRGDLSGGPSDETAKTEVRCHSNFGTIKIPTYKRPELGADSRAKLQGFVAKVDVLIYMRETFSCET